MPQLCKGGKWVFGWTVVQEDRSFVIPPEAFMEYGYITGECCVLIRGSKRSGGFGLARCKNILNNEHLVTRLLANVEIRADASVPIPEGVPLMPGDWLLAVRGSGHALGFLQHGPIVDAASSYLGIEIFPS